MDLDRDRWLALLTAYRNARDEGPALLQIQQSQSAVAQAQADLDRFRARGPTGHGDRRNSPADVVADFDRSIAELEARVVERQREADRVAARSKACAAKRNALGRLVDGVREWAKAQSPPINLPGDDDDGVQMPPFAASTTRIPTSPAREFVP